MKKIQFIVLHMGHGGVQKSVATQANMLSDSYKIEIVSLYQLKDEANYVLNESVKMTYLSDMEPNRKEFKDAIHQKNIYKIFFEGFKAIKTLVLRKSLMSKFLNTTDADILISTRILYNSMVGKKSKNCITIAEEHREPGLGTRYLKKFKKSVKRINYLLPVSEKMTLFYKEYLRNLEIEVVHMPNSFEPMKEKVKDYNSKKLISVGRLEPVKAFDELIEIVKLVIDNDPKVLLNIIGDGSQKEELSEKIKTLGLSKNVFLLGYKDEKEIENLLAESSLFLMTSHEESFGIALLEAMSVGLPSIVYSSANGFVEILGDSGTGIIIESRRKKEFSQSVIDLLNNEEKMKAMGTEAISISSRFAVETIKKKMIDFLKEIENV